MHATRKHRRRRDDWVRRHRVEPLGRPWLRAHERALMGLQREAGNAAVCQLVRPSPSSDRSEGGGAAEEPDWEAPIETEADDRAEGESGRRSEGGGGAAAAPVAAAPAAMPGYRSMRGNGTVLAEAWTAWKETLRAATAASRREQGFWIQWDSGTTPNANGTFKAVGHVTAPAAAPAATATINLGARPADADGWYTVGSFHTHTPTTHRAVGRPVGPSGADERADTRDNVAGLVYDYVAAREGNIPAKWPLWSTARLYHSGPQVRV